MASVHNLIVKRGEAEILKNFSAEFPEHQVTAVSGRSGCGKTTLLSVLLNLLPADSGEIHGFQKPSAVFQEDRLLPYLTAAKNISVAAGCTETAAEKALLQVGFDPEDLKKNAVQLSGGMAQRAAIARSLVTKPEILLLDEPFAALDALTRIQMQQEVRRLQATSGITMVLVTHDIDEAVYLGDRIVVMSARPGRIAEILPVPAEAHANRSGAAFAACKERVLAHFFGAEADR